MAAFKDRMQAKPHATVTNSHSRYVMEPAQFFRGVDVPAYILEAYDRLNDGESNSQDELLICEFRELFCFGSDLPARNETVSVECVVFDPEIYDVLKQDALYRDEIAKDERNAQEAVNAEGSASVQEAINTKKQIRRAKKGADVGKTKQISQQPYLRRLQPAKETSMALVGPKRVEFAETSVGGRQLRRMPSRESLRQLQLSIQESIVLKCAEQEREASSMSNESSPTSFFKARFRRGSLATRESSRKTQSSSSSETTSDLDRALEVHAAASQRLKLVLKDRLQDMTIATKDDVELEGEEKREEVQNLLQVSQRKFEEILAQATTTWSPSDDSITKEELAEAVDGYLDLLDFLRDAYPSMLITDIMKAFKKLEGRATLAQIVPK